MSGTGRDAGTGRGANGGRGASRQPGEHIVSFEPKDVASQRRVAFGVASAAYGLFRLTSKMRIENAQALPVGAPPNTRRGPCRRARPSSSTPGGR